MRSTVEIGAHKIGDGQPTFIVAEAGCNHNGSLEIAKALVGMAANAGADVVKFQTYNAESMYSRQTPMIPHFRERMGFGEGATMYDLIKVTELPYGLHSPIVDYCRQIGIPFISTPFSPDDVSFLETFDVPAYKIASFEMTHYPLLRSVGATRKPVLLSTGMSTLGDIEKALYALTQTGNDQVIMLHCVSNYPARPEDYNLRNIETLKRAFGCPVGLSDHTFGVETAKIAIAAGANLIEKHITIDKSLAGPDHYFSLSPEELNAFVAGARQVESMLGSARKQCTQAEEPMKHIARRSLVAACEVPAGARLSAEMVAIKRPGFGLHPELLDVLMGTVTQRAIAADEPLDWGMFLQIRE